MTVQKHIRLDDDVVKLIGEFRKSLPDIPSFNKAVDTLLRYGLAQFFPESMILSKDEVEE